MSKQISFSSKNSHSNCILLQALLIHLARQETEPKGWDQEDFNGAFPEGGTYTIKLLLPPTHRLAAYFSTPPPLFPPPSPYHTIDPIHTN